MNELPKKCHRLKTVGNDIEMLYIVHKFINYYDIQF